MELYVWDTELTVGIPGRCYFHTKTKHKPKLTDGKRHPVVIIPGNKKVVSNANKE